MAASAVSSSTHIALERVCRKVYTWSDFTRDAARLPVRESTLAIPSKIYVITRNKEIFSEVTCLVEHGSLRRFEVHHLGALLRGRWCDFPK